MFNDAVSDPALMACPHCDLLQRLPAVQPGDSVRCPRCDKELWRHREDALNRTLALAVAAAVLYVIANVTPMLGLSAVGHSAFTTVIGGARHLWDNGEQTVAALVFWTAVVAPALQIGFTLAIVLGAYRARPPRWVGTLLRHHPPTFTWTMIEVMLLGVLVALIKIADYASVIPGVALYVLGTLVFVLAAMQASFDRREVWDRIRWAANEAHSGTSSAAVASMNGPSGFETASEKTRPPQPERGWIRFQRLHPFALRSRPLLAASRRARMPKGRRTLLAGAPR